MPHNTPDFLTPAETAALLRVSMTTLRKMLRERRLRHFKVGRRIRIARADFDAFLDASRVETVAVAGTLAVTETPDTVDALEQLGADIERRASEQRKPWVSA